MITTTRQTIKVIKLEKPPSTRKRTVRLLPSRELDEYSELVEVVDTSTEDTLALDECSELVAVVDIPAEFTLDKGFASDCSAEFMLDKEFDCDCCAEFTLDKGFDCDCSAEFTLDTELTDAI